MDAVERNRIKSFIARWTGKGDEKSDTQKFWIDLLQSLFGLTNAVEYIQFEERIKLENIGFIDAYIPSTKVLIEQKSIDVNLDLPKKQSDGEMLTPYQQAERYNSKLSFSERARWIVVCNFNEFRIYDMDKKGKERDVPEILTLADLENESHVLGFLVDENKKRIIRETEISVKAGELVGKLHKALKAQYDQPMSDEDYQSLNKLCVRLVFCLYAEDTDLFGSHLKFHDFLENQYKLGPKQVRKALIELFGILNTKPEDRKPYGDEELYSFPYVNGGLFQDDQIIVPRFDDEIVKILLDKASAGFNWKDISPTIFGAVFESTLESTERRSGGMHYTSVENIQKVINPLFMDGLREEFEKIKSLQVEGTRRKRLMEFQKKLGSLKFFDPACGSGNFLTETYIELRRMENEILKLIYKGQMSLGEEFSPIQVHINQFYGIEINDFAVSVAQTALWIAESQMMRETEDIVQTSLDFLPLKSFAHIVEGNALRMDWNELVPANELSYIMGNPPFIGFNFMTSDQRDDMKSIFSNVKNLDYVCGWFKKASSYIEGTKIEVSFVATNSIVQGETVPRFWQFLPNDKINFAYITFRWDSESDSIAHVHCVIIGFAKSERAEKYIFDGTFKKKVRNINRYLIEGDDVLVTSRNKPICNVPSMVYGNKPADGGNLIIEAKDYEDFIAKDPYAKKFIRPLLGATEYINGKTRWCLWLEKVPPEEIRKCPLVMQRIQKCKEMRKNSIAPAIRKFAETPALFAQRTQPMGVDYIIVPCVSSEQRKYVPMSIIPSDVIVTNAVEIIPNAGLYHFGILTSNVHMAWMRVVAGRLEMRYRYSKDVVYNNFVWCNPTEDQKMKIEQAAQAILDVRAKYPNSSLADLYDPLTMPADLLKAHQANDKAVMDAYGFKSSMTEPEIVAELFKLYQAKVKEIEKAKTTRSAST